MATVRWAGITPSTQLARRRRAVRLGMTASLLTAAIAAGAGGLPAPAVSAAGATAAAEAGAGDSAPRVSPYVLAGRRHLQAASAPGSPPVGATSVRRSRQAIGQLSRQAADSGGS